MSALERKLVRDLWRLKGQVVTIALVLACGIMAMIMMRSTFTSLLDARDAYYDRYRFADAFVRLQRAPQAIAAHLEQLPGVAVVETRVVEDIMVPISGESDPASGRIVSIPDVGEPRLNALFLRSGRAPMANADDEVAINEAFAKAHGLQPGDRLPVIIEGTARSLRVVGIALSPEYVLAMSGRDGIPDPRRFVVAWMTRGAVARAFHMEGAFNDASFRLAPGASVDMVLDGIDRQLARYGGMHAVGRDKQISNYMLTTEFDALRAMAIVIPAIFLFVAAFLVNVVVSRLVFLERGQIAVLKALGFRDARIGAHYLVLVGLIVAIASVVGLVLGYQTGLWMANMYTEFYAFPTKVFHVSPSLVLATIAIGLGAAVLGALGSVRKIAKLPPAEAMRPPSPLSYRRTILERLGVARLFGPAAMMVVREIQRRPVRFAMSTLGIAMGVTIFVMGRFSQDSFGFVMEETFPRTYRQDLTVAFERTVPVSDVRALARIPGVTLVEPQRVVPVRVHAEHRWRDTTITGLAEGQTLRAIELPGEGLVMNTRLAEILGARVGDAVRLDLLEGDWSSRDVPIAALVDEPFGLGIYARADWLARVLRESPRASLVAVSAEPDRLDAITRRLQAMPAVFGITRQSRVIQRYREQMGESMGVMTLILTLSAAAIATGVVYNNARIALSMRARDLASLRVLGFTRREISSVLLGEMAGQVLFGIPLGLVLGTWGARLIVKSMEAETFSFPFFIAPSTYAAAATIALVSGIASALLVRRKLDQLDLVEVLKSAE